MPFVRALCILLYPIAKPMSMVRSPKAAPSSFTCFPSLTHLASSYSHPQLLDYLFGAHDDGKTYRKAELKAFVALGVEDKLADDELLLFGSVLEFSSKTVASVMVPIADVYKLPADRLADDDLIIDVLRKGHTRIPVHDAKNPGAYM